MPWSMPVPMLGGGRGYFQETWDAGDGKQQDLNLWNYFGQPTQPSDVDVVIDNVEICTFSTGPWPEGTVINMTLTTNALVTGRGGSGGNGGESFFEGLLMACVGLPGTNGGAGSPALTVFAGIELNLDADEGYIWGGGGGGGGGGYGFFGACESGCGGGGAQGWDINPGGTQSLGGSACVGTDGGPSGPGNGGVLGGYSSGGNGGSWGQAGVNGTAGPSGGNGTGGLAGYYIFGSPSEATNFVGAKSQVTLEGEGRLLGQYQ